MCDCYNHQCADKNCKTDIDMHLSDFDTERNEIKVYCSSHIPIERNNGVLWKVPHGKSNFKIFVECLTNNAKKKWKGNSYNGTCSEIEVFGVKRKNNTPVV